MKDHIENLNKVLGVANNMVEEDDPKLPSVTESDKKLEYNGNGDLEQDYNLARNTLHGLVTSGNQALTKILELASESDHPRTFEVTANLLKTVADISKDLLILQKDMKDLTKPVDGSAPNPEDEGDYITTSPAKLLDEMEEEDKTE